jgi:alpha-glucosidase
MEMALPANVITRRFSSLPTGYQAFGDARIVAKSDSHVCLRAGSATIEVTVLAPDLFRVGIFPDGRAVDYHSEAVVKRDWDAGSVRIEEEEEQLILTTTEASAHIALNALRLSFSDKDGRVFAADDPVLGMGWFPESSAEKNVDLVNPAAILGTPVRVYKQHRPGEHYFGCGERTGDLDKTGSHQLFWNIDPPRGHTALQNNLYVSIPFTLVLDDGRAWGLFLDSTSQVEFDLAREDSQRSWFEVAHGDLVYYVFCGPTPREVVGRYTDLTGHTPLPPLWSLGNGQSRFSYETAEEVRNLARTFRERDIPCDTIYLDIDALEGYRVFTWDKTRFPDPAGLFMELREMGFHIVSIVDAGVKVDEQFVIYREGRERDLYCKTAQGTDYENAVWPGVCVFPDFTNPQARKWWGEKHQALLDVGVAGIWSDMNEPALFIPLNSTMPAEVVHPGGGRTKLHLQVHNAYGSLMVQSAREGLLQLRPEQRPFIITRAGYAGVQRHALVWTGDNSSTWEHLALSLPQLQNLGLSGVGWCGVDIGGFYGDATGELMARWTELGIFQAFCRNHSEKQTLRQEPWVFGEPYESVCREMLKLRQRLLPYLYSLFDECHRTGAPVLRPLFWAYPADTTTYALDDQVLCGDTLLIAPILRPGHEYRSVYIPAGTWFHYWTGERIDGPAHILAHAPLGQPAFYVRANAALPLWPATSYVDQVAPDPLTLLLFPAEGSGQATLYEDAGNGYEYQQGVYARRTIICAVEAEEIHVGIGAQEGSFVPSRQHVRVELRAIATTPQSVRVNEQEAVWQYYSDQRCVVIELPAMMDEQAVVLRLERAV